MVMVCVDGPPCLALVCVAPSPGERPGPRLGLVAGVPEVSPVVFGSVWDVAPRVSLAVPGSVWDAAPPIGAELALPEFAAFDARLRDRSWAWSWLWVCGHPGPLRFLAFITLRLEPGAICLAMMLL